MTESNRQPGDESGALQDDQSDRLPDVLPDALTNDLVAMFRADIDTTPVRHALANEARAHFVGVVDNEAIKSNQNSGLNHSNEADEAAPIRAWWARWPVAVSASAAGMAAAIGLVVWLNSFAPVHDEPDDNTGGVALVGDVDRNGKVDILDAYQLQRSIESSLQTGDTLTSEWDMTGDGQVNRDDVTAVAMLAVKMEGGRRS